MRKKSLLGYYYIREAMVAASEQLHFCPGFNGILPDGRACGRRVLWKFMYLPRLGWSASRIKRRLINSRSKSTSSPSPWLRGSQKTRRTQKRAGKNPFFFCACLTFLLLLHAALRLSRPEVYCSKRHSWTFNKLSSNTGKHSRYVLVN